jgi:hypothetical protein
MLEKIKSNKSLYILKDEETCKNFDNGIKKVLKLKGHDLTNGDLIELIFFLLLLSFIIMKYI